jgi:hypothetical protein
MTYNQKCNLVADCIMQGKDLAFVGENVVVLPSPQRTGTYTQQRTYALLKAREIVDNLKPLTT